MYTINIIYIVTVALFHHYLYLDFNGQFHHGFQMLLFSCK